MPVSSTAPRPTLKQSCNAALAYMGLILSSATSLQALNGFLAKAGGKDKLTALIQVRNGLLGCAQPALACTLVAQVSVPLSMQYTCMFISAGEPGNAKKIQASVAAARKVFRVFGVRSRGSPVLH